MGLTRVRIKGTPAREPRRGRSSAPIHRQYRAQGFAVRSARLIMSAQTIEKPKVALLDEIQQEPLWNVTVYNNDHNTYEEVMTVLQLATGCSVEEAYIETWEVDHLGASTVHRADEAECIRVADIIRVIGIRVEVTQEAL